MEFLGIEDIVEHEECVQNKRSENDGVVKEADGDDMIRQHALRRFGLAEQEAEHVLSVLYCSSLGSGTDDRT